VKQLNADISLIKANKRANQRAITQEKQKKEEEYNKLEIETEIETETGKEKGKGKEKEKEKEIKKEKDMFQDTPRSSSENVIIEDDMERMESSFESNPAVSDGLSILNESQQFN